MTAVLCDILALNKAAACGHTSLPLPCLHLPGLSRNKVPSWCCPAQVRDRLLAACTSAGVLVRYSQGLAGLEVDSESGGWRCRTRDGAAFSAQHVVRLPGS